MLTGEERPGATNDCWTAVGRRHGVKQREGEDGKLLSSEGPVRRQDGAKALPMHRSTKRTLEGWNARRPPRPETALLRGQGGEPLRVADAWQPITSPRF